MNGTKMRPITFIKPDDSESIQRRKRAALYWQKTQRSDGLASNLDELARQIHYCSKTALSDFLNGRRELSPLTLKIFAQTCGVRLDYLLEIDNFMNQSEIDYVGGADRVNGISLQIELLKCLGYKLESILNIEISEWRDSDGVVRLPFTQEQWSIIKPTLTEEALSFELQTFDGMRIPLREWDGNFENVQTRNILGLRARCAVNGSTTNGYMPYNTSSPDYPGLRYRLVYIISKDSYSFDMRMDELASLFNNVTGYLNVEMASRIRFSDAYQKEQARLLSRRPEHGND